MLKLERVSHDNQISVGLRDKKQLFTRSLVTALSIAVGLHLLLLVLFNVSPIKIRWGNSSFLPVMVEADVSSPNDSLVLASINHNLQPRTNLLEPKPSLPAFPASPTFLPSRQMEFISEKVHTANPFSQIEKAIYQPTFPPSRQQSVSKPIQLVISGPLATKTILKNPVDQVVLPALTSSVKQNARDKMDHLRVIYSVQVDEQTGRIFWTEQKQKTDIPQLDLLAESILKNLQFVSTPASVATSGEIELHFNVNATASEHTP